MVLTRTHIEQILNLSIKVTPFISCPVSLFGSVVKDNKKDIGDIDILFRCNGLEPTKQLLAVIANSPTAIRRISIDGYGTGIAKQLDKNGFIDIVVLTSPVKSQQFCDFDNKVTVDLNKWIFQSTLSCTKRERTAA